MELTPRATIDFETRSACSLRSSGAWRYSLHPSTQVLCMAFRLPYWEEGRTGLWHPAFLHLGIKVTPWAGDVDELIAWIEEGGLVEAHNVWFEFCIWRNQLVTKHRFPAIPDHLWRCSAAKAASHALPRGLDKAAAALGLTGRKDPEGTKKMKESEIKRMFKPRKPRKGELAIAARAKIKPKRYYWWESRTSMQRMFEYCRLDVLAEEGLSEALPDLSKDETTIFSLDLQMNQRGFQLDQGAVNAALRLITEEEKVLNGELASLTGGKVKKATQRAQMMKWLATHGMHLEDTKADTIKGILEENDITDETSIVANRLLGMGADPLAIRGLMLMKELGRSSTAKYAKMRDWMDTDGRVRGGLLYHGASTGRWSGAGVQPHNFVRSAVDDIEGLWRVLKTGSRSEIANFPNAKGKPIGSVMDALANGLRGAIVAAPGSTLYVSDYSGIEARVLLWIADDEDGLDIFRSGRDIYCEMASAIYGRPITKKDPERQVGKAAILGLGYQMGWAKFQATAAKAGSVLDDAMCQTVVQTYREKFHRVKSLWYDQEAAAIRAVQTPGKQVWAGRIRWRVVGRFLYCILPSGRRLAYPDPELREKMTPWGEMKAQLTYKGIGLTHQWERQASYGGMLVENIVQAVARDLMAEAMLRIERTGVYRVVLTVHDEIIAESERGEIKQFEKLMAECPKWAIGCPVSVEGFAATRYKK